MDNASTIFVELNLFFISPIVEDPSFKLNPLPTSQNHQSLYLSIASSNFNELRSNPLQHFSARIKTLPFYTKVPVRVTLDCLSSTFDLSWGICSCQSPSKTWMCAPASQGLSNFCHNRRMPACLSLFMSLITDPCCFVLFPSCISLTAPTPNTHM